MANKKKGAKRKPAPKQAPKPAGGASTKAVPAQDKKAARRAAKEAERKRQERLKLLRKYGRTAAIAVLIGAAVLILLQPAPELTGVTIPPPNEQFNLAAGETYEYNTSTPVTGPYYIDGDADPVCAVFSDPLPPEQVVTALAHDNLVIWHRPDISESLAADVVAIQAQFADKVFVVPAPDLDSPLAIGAWKRFATYDDASLLEAFIDQYSDRGPRDTKCRPAEAEASS